ncbi:MAG: anti-phage dCTP deaminase [Rhodospirillales bacterium]
MAEPLHKALPSDKGVAPAISIADRRTPELVFAFVGPAASGVTTTAMMLKAILEDEYNYNVHYYKVSDLIADSAKNVDEPFDKNLQGHERTQRLQDIGNKLRHVYCCEYLIEKCIEQIALNRVGDGYAPLLTAQAEVAPPLPLRRAHFIDSLKHPEEVNVLRDVYGDIFWLIAVFAPEDVREKRLLRSGIAKAATGPLISRDEHEEVSYGQKVRETSHLADFFVRNDKENTNQLKVTISRYCDILFSTSIITPARDESAMYNAMAAASRSACMSRQVGAAIYSEEGELIGIGWNDVPKSGGGLYTTEDRDDDHRCYLWGERLCHNDKQKEELYAKIISSIQKAVPSVETEKLRSILATTGIRSLIEFSRAVHAEMEAIISVARSAKDGLRGSTLFSTTFPCHSCARHIVASGIAKVVYIEPYPKSLALNLHEDSVSMDEKDNGRKVIFLQYEGVAPRNMLRLFKNGLERKENGRVVIRDKKTSFPVFPQPLDSYVSREQMIVNSLEQREKRKGLGVLK